MRLLLAALALAGAISSAHAGPYRDLIARAAAEHGVPSHVAHALVRRESGGNPRAVGRAGEIGLVQIKLATARGLGFQGTRAQLFDPATNLKFGMMYAAKAIRCGGIRLYQRGIGNCGR